MSIDRFRNDGARNGGRAITLAVTRLSVTTRRTVDLRKIVSSFEAVTFDKNCCPQGRSCRTDFDDSPGKGRISRPDSAIHEDERRGPGDDKTVFETHDDFRNLLFAHHVRPGEPIGADPTGICSSSSDEPEAEGDHSNPVQSGVTATDAIESGRDSLDDFCDHRAQRRFRNFGRRDEFGLGCDRRFCGRDDVHADASGCLGLPGADDAIREPSRAGSQHGPAARYGISGGPPDPAQHESGEIRYLPPPDCPASRLGYGDSPNCQSDGPPTRDDESASRDSRALQRSHRAWPHRFRRLASCEVAVAGLKRFHCVARRSSAASVSEIMKFPAFR